MTDDPQVTFLRGLICTTVEEDIELPHDEFDDRKLVVQSPDIEVQKRSGKGLDLGWIHFVRMTAAVAL